LAADLRTPPPGCYYLVDAGYGIRAGFLPPYRGIRYHLKEQYQSQQKPENKEELFNLRYAQLRNIIERIFGILKRRFRILRTPPKYHFSPQVKLVFALTALHNFIRLNSDGIEDNTRKRKWTDVENEDGSQQSEGIDSVGNEPLGERSDRTDIDGAKQMSQLRERIAEDMWRDYDLYLERQRR